MVDISKAPWTYEYEPYTSQEGKEIPNYTIYSNEENPEFSKVCDTNENAPAEIQECNAKRIVASNHLLASLQALLECAELNQDDLEPHTREQIEVARIAIDLAIGKGNPA